MAEAEPRPSRSLRLLARIVPAARRDDWLREWSAELWHDARAGATRARQQRRLLDAAEDALRLRWRGSTRPRGPGIETWLQDVRYGGRALYKRPLYTTGAGLALAMGIGANTAIFSVVNGVLFHELPYESPEELVILWGDGSARGLGLRAGVPPADFLEWREGAARSFIDLAALRNSSRGFTELEEPLVPLTHEVTTNYFDVLGVEAFVGRTFEPADEDREHVVILSHGVWQRAFAGDTSVIGNDVILDEIAYTVVGVLPPDFYSTHQLPVQPDLWVPVSLAAQLLDRSDRRHAVFARLRPGVTTADAQEEMDALALSAEAEFPDSHTGWRVAVVPVMDNAVGPFRSTFNLLLLAVGTVLLIACANVANLTLAQTMERSGEVALRAALGAGRTRILRQLLTESLLLAGLGGALGCLLALWSVPLMLAMIPGAGGGGSTTVGGAAAVPFLDQVGIDTTVLAFAVVVTLLTGIVSGLVPARQASRGDLHQGVVQQVGRTSTGPRGRRFRNALVVAETALALVLVCVAALLTQSLINLANVDNGYDAERLLTLRNSLRAPQYAAPESWIAHFREAIARLEAVPEIESATAASFVPPEFANTTLRFHRAGEAPEAGNLTTLVLRTVMPGYFDTMGIEILEGRPIDERDVSDGKRVAVVNDAYRTRVLGDEPALGERLVAQLDGVATRFYQAAEGGVEWEIVGVAGNVRGAGADPASHPIIYVSAQQIPLPIMNLVVRTNTDPATVARAAQDAVWSLGRSMNVYSVEPLDVRLGNLAWQSRFSTRVLTLFAALALVLGTTGIYAVLNYSVSRRTREVGVRMALGADRGAVLRLVVLDGLKVAAVGLAVGGALAYVASRWLGDALYEVAPGDPRTVAIVTLVLACVAVLACSLPAMRASRVDPIRVLRS